MYACMLAEMDVGWRHIDDCLVVGARSTVKSILEGDANYRRQVCKSIWMSGERLDWQHTVLRLARSVSAPTRGDAGTLKRCVRYLARTRDYKQHLVGGRPWQLVVFADADCAGVFRHYLRSITG